MIALPPEYFHAGEMIGLRAATLMCRHAEFAPDGRSIVIADHRQGARIWNLATGEPITPPMHLDGLAAHAAFSSDGQRVVIGGVDGTARVWDAATGQAVTPALAHRGAICHTAFSPDGMAVLTVSEDETARVWDGETGAPITPPLPLPNGRFVSAEITPSGFVLICGSESCRIWPLHGEERPTAELVRLARIYSARRIDKAGVLLPLTSWEMRLLFEQLRASARRTAKVNGLCRM